jgi:hypothetical protein
MHLRWRRRALEPYYIERRNKRVITNIVGWRGSAPFYCQAPNIMNTLPHPNDSIIIKKRVIVMAFN